MTIWGSSGGFRSPLTGLQEWERIDDAIAFANGGDRLQARRTYGTTMHTTIVGTYAEDDIGNRVSIFSMRPTEPGNTGWEATLAGDDDAAIRSFVQSVPAGHQMFLTYNHEPENDGGSAKQWRKAAARFMQIVLDEGNTDIIPAFNLMGYTWQTAARNPRDWNPGRHMAPDERAACVGAVDAYGLAQPTVRTPSFLFTEPFNDIVDNWGFRYGIFEAGVDDVTGRGQWMLDLETWVGDRTADVDVVSWWHSEVAGYPSTWLDGDAGTSAALADFADVISRNQDSSLPTVDVPAIVLPAAVTVSASRGVIAGSPSATGVVTPERLMFVGNRMVG